MHPQFVFPIYDLQQVGMRDVDAPLTREWMADALKETEVTPAEEREGRVELRLVTSGRDVIVRGTVSVPVIAACARCTKPTPIELQTEIALFLVPERGGAHRPAPSKPAKAGKAKADKADAAKKLDRPSSPKARAGKGKWHREEGEDIYEFSPDEADADTYTGDEIVLDGFLREAILLEIPIFPLCSEECPGIGPVPAAAGDADAADQPIDPRLAPLLALKKKS